jgi:imidazolonepropionase-like amidohydrolase
MLFVASALALVLGDVAARHQDQASPKNARPIAIQADKIYLGDGTTIANGVILIDGGLIRAVGAGVDIPENASVIAHKGAASAGMIAMHGYAGAASDTHDATRAVMSDAEVALSFRSDHYDFADALKAGITSVVLSPTPQGLVGGVGAVVKTASGRMVVRDAELTLSFSSDGLSRNRFPTSYTGALGELEQRFTEPSGNFAKAASGKLPVVFEVNSREDVSRAIEFAKRHKLVGALSGADWAGELAPAIKTAHLSVICGPLDVGEPRRAIKSVVAISEAGIPFGFGLDEPWKHPAALRLSAAMCVREGLPSSAAWRALTSSAAEIIGAGARVGRLERGFDADVVLWSGDPLDLSSSVQAVFVDGERVYGADQ